MRLRHSLAAAAFGAAALGAALGGDPAHADTPLPLPTSLQLVEVNTSPDTITVRVPDLVEVQVSVPLPLPTALPLPLPSAAPAPAVGRSSADAVGRSSTVVPTRPARPSPSSSPQATTTPSGAASPTVWAASRASAAPSTSVPATTSRGVHGTSDGRTPDRARVVRAAVTDQPPRPPARPRRGHRRSCWRSHRHPPAPTPAAPTHPRRQLNSRRPAHRCAQGSPSPPPTDAPPADRWSGSPPPQRLLITHSRPRR
ncbi:hypothetical protein NKG94_04485 [Micromonospora sp. M12]